MATLFSETWTGTTGAAWPATWQPQADQTGTATVQANAGQLVAPASSNGAARQQTASTVAGGDYDFTLTATVPAGQPNFSMGLAWRADTTSEPAALPGSRMFPSNGQSLRLDTNGDLYLYRQNNGSLTVLTSTPTNVGALVGAGPRSLRVQQIGTAIRVKIWATGAAEPSVWTLQVTDVGAWTTGGRFTVAIASGFGGPSGSASTAQFDDLVVSDAGTTTTTPAPPAVGARRNWVSLTATEQQAVIDGFLRVKAAGTYDNLTRMHQQAMTGMSTDWHQRSIFLPVHRWFLSQLENAMGVAIPYWDWVNQGFPSGLGGNGTAAQGYRVTTGPFAGWSSVVYNSSTGAFSTRAGLIRQFANSAATLPTAAQQNSILAQTVYDSAPWNSSATRGIRNWMEGFTGNPGPAMHNRVHEWVGGDMRVGTSPNDPVFWLHHANVDRIWGGWQSRRGLSSYAAPSGQGPNDPMPSTGGVTPAQMFPIPNYDLLP